MKYWQVEFVHRGFTRLIVEKTTLMKINAIIEKITGCYALFLFIHRISVVNSSDWTSSLLRGAESSQGMNNHHWVLHGLVFGHTSSLAAPAMLSTYVSTSGFQVLPQFYCQSVLFPRPFCCPVKCLSSTTITPFTISISAHGLQEGLQAHAPAILESINFPAKRSWQGSLFPLLNPCFSADVLREHANNPSLGPDASQVFSMVW